MIPIELEGKNFGIYSSWSEMPLRKYIDYIDLLPKRPKVLKLTPKYIKWYEDMFFCVTTVTSDFRGKINATDVLAAVNLFSNEIIGKPLNQKFESFTFQGDTYSCPLSKVGRDGNYIPMAEMTTDEMIDVFILLQGHEDSAIVPIEKVPQIIGSLFRKEGEQFSDELAAERSKLFLDLPTSTAMGAYFFLLTRFHLSDIGTQLYGNPPSKATTKGSTVI